MNPTKKQRAKPKRDDKAQSKRSIQTVKEKGADYESSAADEIIGTVVEVDSRATKTL